MKPRSPGVFRGTRLPVIALLVWLAPASLRAQAPPQPVSWSIALDSPGASGVSRGGRVTLVVTAKIAEGWHVYGTDELKDGPRPLAITLPPGQPFKGAGKLQAPEPERDFDASFNQVTTYYNKTTAFRLPLTVSKDAPAAAASINVEIAFQACDGRICLPGRTAKLSSPVTIR